MSHDKHLRCSFCGKSKDSVRKFISGPSVYICNECIALCNEILARSEEHTSELQSQSNLVCRLLLEKKKNTRPHSSRKDHSPQYPEPQDRRRALEPPDPSMARTSVPCCARCASLLSVCATSVIAVLT